MLYENVCKILQNWQEITFVKVSFWWNFFEFLKYKKLRAKHKFVNGYSATKRAPLYCQLASFNFSISSSHLDLVYHQFVFLTWIHVHNLSFSVQAGFNYRLHDYFELVYMEWNLSLVFSNRGKISARFTVMKFFRIIVFLFLQCCCLTCETKYNHHGLTAWNFNRAEIVHYLIRSKMESFLQK